MAEVMRHGQLTRVPSVYCNKKFVGSGTAAPIAQALKGDDLQNSPLTVFLQTFDAAVRPECGYGIPFAVNNHRVAVSPRTVDLLRFSRRCWAAVSVAVEWLVS
jgi:hypothetical protein